jgi:DNA-directed RNA polymerase specialized sigma24 family protein
VAERAEDCQEFREFAGARAAQLFRIAYLICGDWHEAQDLVQTTLLRPLPAAR